MTYRLHVEGDTDAAKMLLPTARKFLDDLKRSMAFGNLGQLQRTIRLASGAVIHVERVLGQDTINIEVPEVIEIIPEEVEELLPITINFVVIEAKNPVLDSVYIIWDISSETLYTGFSNYPITQEELDGWITSSLAEDVTDDNAIYSVVLAGETVHDTVISDNTGCGELLNEQSNWWGYWGFFDVSEGNCGWADNCCIEPREWYAGSWHGTWDTCPECSAGHVWYDEIRWHDMKAFILGPLKSYNLTIQVPGSFVDLTSCVRNHTLYYEREFEPGVGVTLGQAACQEFPPTTTDMRPCGCSELPIYPTSGSIDVCHQVGDQIDCELKTPIGNFTSLHLYNEEVKTWAYTGPCTMTPFDIAREWDGNDVPINLTAFSSEVFVQIFGYWGRLKLQERYNTTWSVMGEVKGAVDGFKNTANIDPREQEEHGGFTEAVNNLMNDYIDLHSFNFVNAANAVDLDVKIYEVSEENV